MINARKHHRILPKQQGFTLIEVIIAIGVTVVVGAIAATSISRSVDMKQTLEQTLEELNAVETFWQVLITDLNHAANRRLPSASVSLGERPSAFMGGDPNASGSNYLLGAKVLFFARDGWSNPLQQQRSDLQRVAYRYEEGRLWRDYWAELNQPLDQPPIGSRLLIENLEEIRVRFLSVEADKVVGGPWQDTWPANDGRSGEGNNAWPLPAAVEVTVSLEGYGEVQRIFSLPGA